MANSKITGLTELITPAAGDYFAIVDVSDTSQDPSGTTKKILYSNTGSGGITGPGASTSNAVPRYNGTAGTALKNSGVVIDDFNNISGITSAIFPGSTSGAITLIAPAAAGTHTVSFPALTGTIVLADATQILNNKTFNSTTTFNAVAIFGSTISHDGATTMAFPAIVTNDTFAVLNFAQTFTNKTLTSATNVLGGVTMNLGSDATGDTYYRNSGGVLTRLAKGSDGQALVLASGIPSWTTLPGGGDMILASTQTVTGAKTFNANKLLDKGSMVFNVMAYGAVGDDSTDDTTAIQNTIAAAGVSGGTVWHPGLTFKITASLKLYNATPNPDVPYSNVTLAGAGCSGVGGTVIKQYTTGEDVIKGLNDVTNTVQLLNCTIRDMCLTFGGTPTNSGNGIYLKQVAGGGPSFQGMSFQNLVITNCGGTGKYGFNAESLIVSTLMNVEAITCANGFYLNGAVGGAYGSVSTSVSFINCYANGCTVNGFNILDNTYISFLGTACDFPSGAGTGYLIDGSNSVTFTGAGCELSGTFTGTMFKFTNGSAQCQLYGCYGFQNDNVAVLVTGSSIGITILGFQNNSDTGTSTVGLQVDAGSQVTELDNEWGGASTQRSFNATAIVKRPGVERMVSATSASSLTPNSGIADDYKYTALAANLTINAPTGTPEDGAEMVFQFKDNAVSRTLTWNAIFSAAGAALPTSTTTSKWTTVRTKYNSAITKWQCILSVTET